MTKIAVHLLCIFRGGRDRGHGSQSRKTLPPEAHTVGRCVPGLGTRATHGHERGAARAFQVPWRSQCLFNALERLGLTMHGIWFGPFEMRL